MSLDGAMWARQLCALVTTTMRLASLARIVMVRVYHGWCAISRGSGVNAIERQKYGLIAG
jgi:hypothetical protein